MTRIQEPSESAVEYGNHDADVFGRQIYGQHLGRLSEDFREIGELDDGHIQVQGDSAQGK